MIESLKRFLDTIILLYKDVANYDRHCTIKIAVYSFLGPTAQLGALLLLLLLFKGENEYVSYALKNIDGATYTDIFALSILVILILLAISAYLIYASERMIAELSCRYVDYRVSSIFLAVNAIENGKSRDVNFPYIFSKSRILSRYIELASRQALSMPNVLLGFVYSVVILLGIDIYLTLLLILATAPVVIPLQKNTKYIVLWENKKNKYIKESVKDFKDYMVGCITYPAGKLKKDQFAREQYSLTALSRINDAIKERLILTAKSKALVNTFFVFIIALCVIYISLTHEIDKNTLAAYAIYLISMRMALTSGRQLVSQLTKYSRFYPYINEFLSDYVGIDLNKRCVEQSSEPGPELNIKYSLNNYGTFKKELSMTGFLCAFCYQEPDYILARKFATQIYSRLSPVPNCIPAVHYARYEELSQSEKCVSESMVFEYIKRTIEDNADIVLLDGYLMNWLSDIGINEIRRLAQKYKKLIVVLYNPEKFYPIFNNFEVMFVLNVNAELMHSYPGNYGVANYIKDIVSDISNMTIQNYVLSNDDSYLIDDEG